MLAFFAHGIPSVFPYALVLLSFMVALLRTAGLLHCILCHQGLAHTDDTSIHPRLLGVPAFSGYALGNILQPPWNLGGPELVLFQEVHGQFFQEVSENCP